MKKNTCIVVLLIAMCLLVPQKVTVSAATGDVVIDEVTFPDAIFREYVKANIDTDKDSILQQGEMDAIKEIIISKMGIEDIRGIEHFTKVEKLYASANKLTQIDISKNIALTDFSCAQNQITTLDVSKNAAMLYLECQDNKLSTLDVSANSALKGIRCWRNKLEVLDVSGNAQLEELSCDNNKIKALDMSHNPALKTLECYNNKIESLNVENNASLELLACYNNQIESLNLKNSPVLRGLTCFQNKLESLDLSKNVALKWVGCGQNQLTQLDVSKNVLLEELYCNNNQLTTLDLKENKALIKFFCNNNQLMSLDLRQNIALKPEDVRVDSQHRMISIEEQKGFALRAYDVNFKEANVSDVAGGNMVNGTLENVVANTPLTYNYHCGDVNNTVMNVSLVLDKNSPVSVVSAVKKAPETGDHTNIYALWILLLSSSLLLAKKYYVNKAK